VDVLEAARDIVSAGGWHLADEERTAVTVHTKYRELGYSGTSNDALNLLAQMGRYR
jgi:hypothetical protein